LAAGVNTQPSWAVAYGRHGSCRTTFEGDTAKQSLLILVNLTNLGPYVMAKRFFQ